MPKIGIMGGTFNPIHNAHLEIAQKALNQFGLDTVFLITSGNPPHKQKVYMLDAKIRHKMVTLATDNFDYLFPHDFEVNKKTPSYTYETLSYLKQVDRRSELFLIIGADSLHSIHTWKKPRLVMEMCTLLVYGRDGYNMEEDLKNLKQEYYLKAKFIDSENINISSSQIRDMIANGEDVSQFLPKAVNDYIIRNNLYKTSNETVKKQLRSALTRDRFIHSLNVCQTATELARAFGCSEKKAYLAGILHDCAKCIPTDKMLEMCKDFEIELDEFEEKTPALIHAKLGEIVAKTHYRIQDKYILEAIRCHTLGHPDMCRLSKVIYVADMIEPQRNFEGIDEIREIAKKDLNRAVLECTKATVRFNEAHNRPVHPMAYKVIDSFSEKLKKREQG